MDRPPLQQTMNSAAALGAFDPLALGLTFSCGKYDDDPPPVREIPGTMSRVASGDTFLSLIAALREGVPAELLTHEMTHLYQVTATSSGLREFTEMHRYLLRCCAVSTAMAGRSGGEVPIGFLGHRAGRALPDGLREPVDGLVASRNALLLRKGGVLLPVAALAPYRIRRSAGNIFEVGGIFDGDDSTWCADLTDLGGPAGMAVTLGSVHLFEGQALMAEYVRGITGPHGPGNDAFWRALNSAPPHPYQLARSVFLNYCRDRPAGAISADIELIHVIDAALMADRGHATGNAFSDFMRMCLALSADPALHLSSLAPDQVEAFQDALLRTTDTPVPSMAALSAAMRDEYPPLLAGLRRANPLFARVIPSWSRAFAAMLTERARSGWGGSTALALARMPHEQLAGFALDLMTTTFFQPVSLTDEAGVDRDILSVASLPRVKPILEEILYGPQPCEVRQRCQLPERAACSGLPGLDALRPEGQRCMREYALTTVAELLGIGRLVHR